MTPRKQKHSFMSVLGNMLGTNTKEAKMNTEKMVTPYITQEQFDRVFPDVAAPSTSPEPWVPDLEHVANEWADGLCDASVGLSNIRDGIETVDVLIERVNDSIKHCREVCARWQAAQATPITSNELVDMATRLAASELRANQLEAQFKSQCKITAAALEERAKKNESSTSSDVIKAQEAVYHVCLEKWGAKNGVTIDALAVLNYLKAAPSTSPERILELESAEEELSHARAELEALRAAPGTSPIADELRGALKDMCAEFRALDLPYGSKAYSRATAALNSAPSISVRVTTSIGQWLECGAPESFSRVTVKDMEIALHYFVTPDTNITDKQVAIAIDTWFSKEYEYNSSMETRMRAAIEAALKG